MVLVGRGNKVHTAAMSKGIPSRKEFKEMAARGRLHEFDRDAIIPSDSELDQAQSPLDLGRLYGYSEDDIAHYYDFRRRGHDSAYVEYVRDLEQAKIPPAEADRSGISPPTSGKSSRARRSPG
jgi:hypothetical protein